MVDYFGRDLAVAANESSGQCQALLVCGILELRVEIAVGGQFPEQRRGVDVALRPERRHDAEAERLGLLRVADEVGEEAKHRLALFAIERARDEPAVHGVEPDGDVARLASQTLERRKRLRRGARRQQLDAGGPALLLGPGEAGPEQPLELLAQLRQTFGADLRRMAAEATEARGDRAGRTLAGLRGKARGDSFPFLKTL